MLQLRRQALVDDMLSPSFLVADREKCTGTHHLTWELAPYPHMGLLVGRTEEGYRVFTSFSHQNFCLDFVTKQRNSKKRDFIYKQTRYRSLRDYQYAFIITRPASSSRGSCLQQSLQIHPFIEFCRPIASCNAPVHNSS